MFVDRIAELKALKNVEEAFLTGKKIPLAIIGLRRIGKTDLIQNFRKQKHAVLTVYLNLQGSVSSPVTFAKDFYISVLEEIANSKKIPFVQEGTKEERIINISTLLGERFYNFSMKFLNTLQGNDYAEVLQSTFRFPELMSEYCKKKIIFFMDEFQELEELNNYKFGDVFKIMRSIVEKQENVLYVISGSVISFMEKLIRGSREPFFNQFAEQRLSYFTREDSILLIKHFLKSFSCEKSMFDEIFQFTHGHPFYIASICERLIIESNDKFIDKKLAKYAAMKEIIGKDGKINILFRYIFEESLKKAKRKGNLKSILIALAGREGLNLTQISEELKKPTGQVNNYIKSLLSTDLVFESEKKYFFRDPIFRFWVAKTQLGKDIEITRNERYIDDLLNDLKEKYLRVSSELGKAKEYELKYKLEEKFGLKLENYRKGKIEFDLVEEKNGIWRVFEIKWKNSPADYTDLKKFYENANKVFKKSKLYFVSKSGFTEQAKKFAGKNAIELIEKPI